jgi:hypothetical protein
MACRLRTEEPVAHGVVRVICEQLERARGEVADSELDRDACVHQVRKRCKKIRAVLKLVRDSFPDYRRGNRFFRDLARSLSDARDATVMVECLDGLRSTDPQALENGAWNAVNRWVIPLGADRARSLEVGPIELVRL